MNMITIKKKRTKAAVRRQAAKVTPLKRTMVPRKKKARSYDAVKEFRGARYTGMAVGRSHKWDYDPGEWKESKVTPDLWEFSFAVTKRRAYKAPEGSGVPVGSGYHWLILAHQNVFKLNANEYSTAMSGLKFKVAHKRANKGAWSAAAKAQRKRMITFLEEHLKQLRSEPVPLDFEYGGANFKGEAIPVQGSCHNGICDQHDITLNNEHIGLIRCIKSGWRMSGTSDTGLIEAIGHEIFLWYE
jgi:hypothetical protein